jgi:hypothetical protein
VEAVDDTRGAGLRAFESRRASDMTGEQKHSGTNAGKGGSATIFIVRELDPPMN